MLVVTTAQTNGPEHSSESSAMPLGSPCIPFFLLISLLVNYISKVIYTKEERVGAPYSCLHAFIQ